MLSLVNLPTMPPGTILSKSSKSSNADGQQQKKDTHTLKWQKLLPKNWKLFSTSDINPIISFSNQGTYIIFGSSERWGIVDAETGCELWTLFQVIADEELHSSFWMKPLLQSASLLLSCSDQYQCSAIQRRQP